MKQLDSTGSVRADGQSRRGPVHGRSHNGPGTLSTEGIKAPTNGEQLRFRIRFVAETVVDATDVRDALRQATSLGATEVTAVIREK